MIFVLEGLDDADAPRAWFAYDEADLLRKVGALAPALLRSVYERDDGCAPGELAERTLKARGACRVYWDDAEAMRAFENADDPIFVGRGWRARWALREQLVALDVLADDL